MAKRSKAARARRDLADLRHKDAPLACGEPMRSWYVKYTTLVVDFMLTLPDERLGQWEDLFTALYELTGMGLSHFERDDVLTEEQAWLSVDPWEHMLFARIFTLLPASLDPSAFAADYLAFFVYLGREGVLSREACRALFDRYRELLRVAA